MADQALQSNKSLQNLFASLRPSPSRNQSSDTSANDSSLFNSTPMRQQSGLSAHPAMSDALSNPGLPLPAPPPGLSNPAPSTPVRQSSADLINLLRQTTSTSAGNSAQPPHVQHASLGARGAFVAQQPPFLTQNIHGRGMSSSDIVANFMGKPTTSQSPGNVTPSTMHESHSSSAHSQPQEYLLQLLNKASSSQSRLSSIRQSSQAPTPTAESEQLPLRPASAAKGAASSENHPISTHPARRDSPIRQFGTSESKEPTPFEPDLSPQVVQPSSEKKTDSAFTYTNPFEHLLASSPLQKRSGNATPRKETLDFSHPTTHTPKKQDSPYASPAPVIRSAPLGLSDNGSEVLQSIETPDSKVTSGASTNEEKLMGIGAPTTDTETVAQALNDVGDQVNRQVEHALAQQDKGEEEEEDENDYEDIEDEVEEQLHEAAVEVKEELDKNGNMETLKALLPEDMAKEVKEIIDEAADGNIDGDSSADDEESVGKGEEHVEVPVYNFPMRPFVAIDLHQKEPAPLQFSQSIITDIARLKKEFDQIDRTLASASNDYIVYAMPKPGGFRVIRQDDGLDRQVFKETKDHVFNVALANTGPSKKPSLAETCIATAVSGKVYWAALKLEGNDNLPKDDFEKHCLVFPPVPARDDNTSGGRLKTRAKKSNRHPEFFAIGRGKSIQIIFPMHAQSSKFVGRDHVVDTVGYFKDRSLKINMGKAGKDFTFSEDDSVIVTLDKAGKLRFWDIENLVDESNAIASVLAPIEIKSPVLTFPTGLANEKSWPTSVMFVDKFRAYVKGHASRFVIVGMKQNHILQLWDLGLGKAVQEISFPHEKESDAICSIAYHPTTNIVVVAHPTRNSIYFIHLSAPKYNLPPMSQAKYIERLAKKDPLVQKPESTAIMSAMREYSFSSKGQIRSVDILSTSSGNVVGKNDPSLFELYVMHSKGVTCLNVRKGDLGWGNDMRVLTSRSAEGEGIIMVRELRETLVPTPSEPSSVNGGEAIGSAAAGKWKKKITDPHISRHTADTVLNNQLDLAAPVESAINGAATPIPEKGRKKKKGTHSASEPPPPPAPIPPSANPVVNSTTLTTTHAQPSKDTPKGGEGKLKREMSGSQQISLGISPEFMDREMEKIRKAVSEEFSGVLARELEILHRNIHNDRVALDTAESTKQQEVLRLISASLGDNVEKALTRIITTNVNQTVIPSIHNVTTSTLRKEIPDWLSKHLLQSLPAQMKLALPEAVSKALKPDVLSFLSVQVAKNVSSYLEKQLADSLLNAVLPTVQSLMLDSLSKKIREVETHVNGQIRVANIRLEEEFKKVDQLSRLVQACTETIHTMAASQAQFQTEILKNQQQARGRHQSVSSVETRQGPTASAMQQLPPQELTPEQQELENINATMSAGNYEQGTIAVSFLDQTLKMSTNINSGSNPIVKQHCLTSTLCVSTHSISNIVRPLSPCPPLPRYLRISL